MIDGSRSPIWLLDLGRVEYGAAYQVQRRLLEERVADRVPDLLLLVEHPPVITLGRRGSRQDVLVSQDVLDAPTYVWRLEETISRALAEWDIKARRDQGNRGVFAGEGDLSGKIAAIGVAVSKSITMHGFALNVSPNLDHFAFIDPCGIGELGVTSMERLLGKAPSLDAVRHALVHHFAEVFGRTTEPASDAIWSLIGSWNLITEATATKSE